MLKISSTTNPKIKKVLELRELKNRKKEGLTLIEGEREVLAALRAGIEVRELLVWEKNFSTTVLDIMKKCKRTSCEICEVTSKVFEKIAYGDRKEGVIAVARIRTGGLEDLPQKPASLYLVIEQVEKPGNLGAILRTADAVGVHGVLVCDPATDIYNPNTIRASLGAVFTTPVVTASNEEALRFLKSRKVKIVATSPTASKNYWKLEAKQSLALVLGSETKGLSPFWLKQADESLAIPMNGIIDSLNVSVSTAVILYDINRQRSS